MHDILYHALFCLLLKYTSKSNLCPMWFLIFNFHTITFTVAVLIKFLCGRLSEKYSIVPKILSGLNYFVREREVESDLACSIARELFQSVDVQALHQVIKLRHLFYLFICQYCK